MLRKSWCEISLAWNIRVSFLIIFLLFIDLKVTMTVLNPVMTIFSSFATASPVQLYIVRQSLNQSKYILFQSNYTEGWSVSMSSLESFLFPLLYHCYQEALWYLCWMVSRSRKGPRHVGATGTPIIWRPFKPILCKLFRIRTGSTNFLSRARAQIADNFLINSFTCQRGYWAANKV